MYTYILGADSETLHGKPHTFQFYGEDEDRILWIDNPEHSTKLFLQTLKDIASKRHRDYQYVIYVHNLEFDAVSFFYDRMKIFYDTPTFKFTAYGYEISGLYGTPSFIRIQPLQRGQPPFLIVDSFAWFQTSLAKLAALMCPHLPKLTRPAKLGEYAYTPRNKQFVKYAMRDAEISYFVGKRIEQVQQQYDIDQCLSGPHMSSKIFRKHFLRETIPLPHRKIVYSALHAYHGGKNNITVTPGFYPIQSIDISSAYPFAMTTLPAFSRIENYKFVKCRFHPKYVAPLGIYKIDGVVKQCPWPSLFDHNFKPLFGDVAGVWVTGFELNEAIRAKEVYIRQLSGFYYDAKDDGEYSPFKAFVDTFYDLKSSADDPVLREFYKRPILNSLYGKFIQMRKTGLLFDDLVYDIDDGKVSLDVAMKAGGLFNPFIAALITGHTRAYIHRMEHEYRAAHTSTDGVFAMLPPKSLPAGLGGLSVEAEGTAVILRNKLYAVYTDKPDPKYTPSTIFRNKFISKYALHGFHAKIETFEHLLISGEREYNYTRMNKLRESVRRGLQVNTMMQRSGSLNLAGEQR